MSLRVAFYQGTFQPDQDGTMTVMSRMVTAMEDRGIEHKVFTPLPPPKDSGSKTPVVPLRHIAFPAYNSYAVALPKKSKMWADLDEYDPDLVQLGTPDLGGKCMLKWALARGVAAVGAYHTHFPTYLRYYKVGVGEKLLWKYFRWFYNSCACTLVPTEPIKNELKAQGIKRLVLWPRGVDTEKYSPAKRSEDFRKRAGADKDTLLFAYAGRLVSEKNVEEVATAWASIRRKCPKAKLVWIGDGPRRKAVEKIAPGSFFPGYLVGDELPQAFASVDALVFCSVTETFGNVVLEAMASGLPVVAVKNTAPGSIVEAARGGITVESAEPGDIAAAMLSLYHDRDLREKYAARSLAHARRQRWEDVFNKQFKTYEKVLSRIPN